MKKLICLVLAVMLMLSAVSAFAAEYTDKETVKKVQQALNDAGFDCGTPDGAAGKKTKAAITDYQNANGLTATGVIDDELLVSLGLAEAEAAETTEETPVEAEADETAATDEGYTFQGIPWGSTPEEVGESLVEKGLIETATMFNSQPQSGSVTYYPAVDTSNVNAEVFMDAFTKSKIEGAGKDIGTQVLKSIGGAEPVYVDFIFIYGIEDGKVTDELHLVEVKIHYYNVYDELKEQLIQSYGEVKESTYSGVYLCTWEGTSNTVITLWDCFGEDDLYYTVADCYTMAQEVSDIIKADEAPVEDAGL